MNRNKVWADQAYHGDKCYRFICKIENDNNTTRKLLKG